MIHELKTHPEYLRGVADGSITFEIRKNDRDFRLGHYLRLREYDQERYTGDVLYARITHITDFMQAKDYVVLGIKLVDRADALKGGVAAFLGTWPGEETVAELEAALREVRGK